MSNRQKSSQKKSRIDATKTHLVSGAAPGGYRRAGPPVQAFPLRSMFLRPAYLERSAWIEHLPFAWWLIEAHQPDVMVELGTHLGTSYFAFCQAVEHLGLDTRCFAVDNWKGDEHSGFYGEEVFEKVKAYNDAQYPGFSRLIRSSFDAACGHFSNRTIDLLHLDGYHTLDAVTHDFETWLPKLSQRAVVLLHDSNVRERNFGVFKLFEKLQEQYPAFEFVHGHGLGVLGVGPEQNSLLKQLFKAREDERASRVIHDAFGQLGRACADMREASRLEKELGSERQRRGETEQQVVRLKSDLESRAGLARAVEQALAEARSKLAKAEAATAAERERASRLEKELGSERQRRGETEQQVVRLKSDLERQTHAAERSLLEVRNCLAQTESALVQRRREAEETAGELAAARENLRQAAVARARAGKVSAGLKEHVVLLIAKVKEQQAALAAVQLARATESAETDKAIAAVARQVKQVLAVLDTSRHELATRLSQAEQVRAAQSAELQQRMDEIAILTRLLSLTEGGAAKAEAASSAPSAELQTPLEQQTAGLEPLGRAVESNARPDTNGRKRNGSGGQPLARLAARLPGLINGHALAFHWKPLRIRREVALLRRSGLFDAEWYLREYTDVASAGMEPLRHYVEFGAREGRAPNPAQAEARRAAAAREAQGMDARGANGQDGTGGARQ